MSTFDHLTPEQIEERTGLDLDDSFFKVRAWWLCIDTDENSRVRKLSAEHNAKQSEFCKKVCEELDCDYGKAVFLGIHGVFHMRGFVPNDPENVNENLKLPGANDFHFDSGVYVLDGRRKLGRERKRKLGLIENARTKPVHFLEDVPEGLYISTGLGDFFGSPSVFFGPESEHLPVMVTMWDPDHVRDESEKFRPDEEKWERRPLSELVAYVEYCEEKRGRK